MRFAQSSLVAFDRPIILLLAPLLAALIWYGARKSFAGLSPSSQRAALILRIVLVTLLVAAMAGPHLVVRSKKLATLFVFDVSRSIRPEQRAAALRYMQSAVKNKPSADQTGLVVFGRTSYLEMPPSTATPDFSQTEGGVAGDATDLEGALRLAEAAFPAGYGKKIVLLSDGNENIGEASDEIAELKANGVRVDIAPTALDIEPHGTVSPEAMVDDVLLPARARTLAAFPLRVVASSNVDQSASLTIRRDGAIIGQRSVNLHVGKNAFDFTQTVSQAGFHRFDVDIDPARDSIPENNHAYGFVSVTGRPQVLYVTDDSSPSANLVNAMSEQDIDVRTIAPGSLPANVAALQSYDTILFSNVAAAEISPDQMTAVSESVHDFGVGFGMIGGVNSYGAGQWASTPIEEALPVKMDVPPERKLPNAAVVIVLDASGSMSAEEGGVEKVQLGARAAIQLMGELQPDDMVGVNTVTTVTNVVVPLEAASKAASAREAVQGVSAGGGGIYCFIGLQDAYSELLASHCPIKHVIMCADATDSEQQEGCVALARDMYIHHHISTTVCGMGYQTDPHIPFQRSVASAGGGQEFIVNEATDLPHVFQRDMQTIQRSWFVEGATLPRSSISDSVLSGIPFGAEPPLLGYNLTVAKPGANIGLTAPEGSHPIFAYWRYGLGRTFAFTSDDRAHWAADWLAWPGYTRFWAQALRWSFRSSSAADYQSTIENVDGRAHLVVDAYTAAGGLDNHADLRAKVVTPDLASEDLTLRQTGAGRYEGTFDASQTGAYMVNVRPGSSSVSGVSQTLGYVVPYSPEYRTLSANMPLLADLAENTGGKFQPDPSQVFRDMETWVAGILDIAPALLLTCALLFVADVGVRRLAIRTQQLRATAVRQAQTVKARASVWAAPVNAPVSPPQVDRLLERKLAARAPQTADFNRPAFAGKRTEPDKSSAEGRRSPSTADSGRLLDRKAGSAASGDEAFPQVASLNKRRAPASDSTGQADYTGRLLDVKKRAQSREE